MAVTGTKTVREIVTMAMRKSGILAFGENPASEDMEAAIEELDVMLKGWQNMALNLWTKTSGSLTLTTSAEHTLDPVRPLRILSARYRVSASASELPMTQMMRDEYDTLPVKTTTGTPTQFYYDRQREAARFYVWPVLATATGQTVEYTYDRELEDIAGPNDTLDMPGEWWDAVVYNLAARLMETVPIQQRDPDVKRRAQVLLQQAGAFDQEASIFFAGEYSD